MRSIQTGSRSPVSDGIERRVAIMGLHICCECWSPIDWGHNHGRIAGGYRLTVRHHGMVQTGTVRDNEIEDQRHFWWFTPGSVSTPHETAAERQRRVLREEYEALQARTQQHEDET